MNYKNNIRILFEAVVTENKKKIEALADKGNKRAQDYIRGRGYAKQQGVDHAKAQGNSDWATGVRSLARDREQAMAGGKSLALIGAQRISHNERPFVINTKPKGPAYKLGSSGVSKMDRGYLEGEGRRSMRAYMKDKGARPNQPSEEERYLPKQEENIMNYRESIRLLFEAALLEGERKMQMKRDSDQYPGGPAEKQLYQAKPGQLTPDGKKQLQKASADYAAATKKARDERKVESIRNNFSLILKETFQPGKAKSPDKYGVRRGTAKLSKSSIEGVSKDEAERVSRRNQERDFARQRDAKFRKKHGSMSAAERRKENQLMNRPMGLRKRDPEDHYPQD